MLELQQLEKRYPTGDLALKGVSLNVGAGEVLGLIGPSGAGKSTLIRCVNRLVQPSGGKILLEGQDLSHLGSAGLRRARRQIGMIFQEYALVERLTVMENLLSGRLGYTGFWASWYRRFEPQDIAQAYALLDRVGLSGMENKRADALSGGQRQLLAVARMMLRDPAYVFLDEPTSHMDQNSEAKVIEVLGQWLETRTLILATHRMQLLKWTNRLAVLERGELMLEGSSEEVLKKLTAGVKTTTRRRKPVATEKDAAPVALNPALNGAQGPASGTAA